MLQPMEIKLNLFIVGGFKMEQCVNLCDTHSILDDTV